MAWILTLETASTNCSVGLYKNSELRALREDPSPQYTHGELLHVFIEEVLQEAGISASELNAVAVSQGPGSYTGLRIGVSAAKGLCFALDIPLIALGTLRIMATGFLETTSDSEISGLLIPVLDARRMEVYSAVFDLKGKQLRETRAEVIDEDSFKEYRDQGKLNLLGNGAEKLTVVLPDPPFAFYPELQSSARFMGRLAYEAFTSKKFEDTAYFEPNYLKDFIPGGK